MSKQLANNISNTFFDINPIYKVNYLVDGLIDTIYVFMGKKITNVGKETDLFETIFTEEENEIITTNKIHVVFSEQQIHPDDTIGVIKLKILNEIKDKASLDEIYLFCQKIETLNSVNIYQSLTQNKKQPLTQVRLNQFISNIIGDTKTKKIEPRVKKETYDYDDILEMNLDGKRYLINKTLGMKYFIVENEYPFVSNPYDVREYDSFFEKFSRKTLSTLNSNLLLNTGDIHNNNIFLCLAKDVLEYLIEKSVPENTTIKIYYPFLNNKNIFSLEKLFDSEHELLETNTRILSDNVLENFKKVDLFYDVYKMRKNELKYTNRGIKFIKVVIRPAFTIKLPLDVIFKITHSTEINPLIKYNPSSRQENVYRLYTGDKISTDGRKIPFLKKATIFKQMKNIGKNKSVSIFIEFLLEENTHSMVCEFDENGYITITSEFNTLVNETIIEQLFKDNVNPIIQEIKNYLEQSGYKMALFNSLSDENVEVRLLTYEMKLQLKKPFNIESFKGCISSVFNNESSDFKSGIHLRFKRVANFNKVTSQEAFIIEKRDEGYNAREIVDALLQNYPDDLTKTDAEQLVMKVANEVRTERGARKSEIKIKDNPGFKTTIILENKTGVISIVIENINDINYLTTIPIYLDTILRLTQDEKSTSYPIKEINKICSSQETEDIEIPDIISPLESKVSNFEEAVLDENSGELKHVKSSEDLSSDEEDEKAKNALSLFYGDDEEEEEEERGGAKNSSSDPSIPSASSSDSKSSVPSASSSEPSSSEPSSASQESIKPLQNLPEMSLSASSSKSSQSSKNIEEDSVLQEAKSKSSQESEIVVKKSQTKSNKKTTPKSKSSSEPESEPESEQEPDVSEDEEDEEDEDAHNMRMDLGEEPLVQKELDNMSLRNYFQDRIEELDSPLIVKQKVGNYSIYSKVCQSHQKRQPIILTDEELNKIKKEQKGFLRPEDIIKYGSNKNKQFNYICPRYWCLKTNKPIDPKDLKEKTENGKKILYHPTCGKVLPHTKGKEGKEVILPGHYVYEFYKPKNNNPDYKRYPGFQVDKHPKGYCLPCCFDKYLTEGRINANRKCMEEETENTAKDNKKEQEQDEYIKGPDKFPLTSGRWGYLPVAIQTMLHEVNADCQISKTNTNIKQNHPCLLRHGVEVNNNQSFIACISDAKIFTENVLDKNGKPTTEKAKILSIVEMKNRIIKSLTIDNFIKYQNGNLITDFYNPDKTVDISKYENNNLIKKLNLSNETDKLFFEKVVSAFENFIDFLKDDDVIIDHTYLWDLVCQPNKYLFGGEGINLVILELPKDDITNNVRLICPTNHYSTEFYEARKYTLILMKEDNYYEPIYSYKINNNKITVSKMFSEKEPNLSSTMRAVFKEIIKPFYDNNCRPLPSMPVEYLAKNPIPLYSLIQKLDKREYKIVKLVINFNAKVIGVLAENPEGIKGFVPCYPTALSDNLKQDLDYVLMTDPNLWNTYENTVDFLTGLEKRSSKKRQQSDIPCKPVFKIVEDEMVVGILTETNQFIQISQPIPEQDIRSKKNLISIKDKNYIINKNNNPMVQSDVIISTSNKEDVERVDYIKRIKLETNFYNVFRNTIKILLNDYQHIKVRKQIETELSNAFIIYSQKFKNIDVLLKELVKDSITFTGDKNYYKLINEVSTCIVKDEKNCNDTPNLCAVSQNGKCRLILPEKNLITNKENKEIYFGKISDEIIRFNRIRSFMFQPQAYLSFENIGYNLRENEIIMVQSLLTQEYFENLIPAVINNYVRFNSYDEVEPIISQQYDNNVSSLNAAIGKKVEKICQKNERDHITSIFWKKGFPENFKEIIYNKSSYCTFMCIIDLIEKKTGEKLSVNKLKNVLFEEYKTYIERFSHQIIDILILEGKKTLGDQVKAETLTFSSFIYTDSYFITPLDIWLLVQKYKIPTILISQTTIKVLSEGKQRSFVAYGKRGDDFAFIIIPGLRPQNIPIYKVIESDKLDIFISFDDIKGGNCLEELNSSIDNIVTIEEFLSNFKRPAFPSKKPKENNVNSDSDEDREVIVRRPVKKIAKKVVVEESSPLIEEHEPQPISQNEDVVVSKKKSKKVQYVNKRATKTKKIIPVVNKKITVISD